MRRFTDRVRTLVAGVAGILDRLVAPVRPLIHRGLLRLTAHRRAFRIPTETGESYLYRYYLGWFLGRHWYLHQFVRGDAEPWLHNHPFPGAWAWPIIGGYVEEVLTSLCPIEGMITRERTVGLLPNRIPQSAFHRIKGVQRYTWTLFTHRPRTQSWGFLEFTAVPNSRLGAVVFHQPYEGALDVWPDAPEWFCRAHPGRHLRAIFDKGDCYRTGGRT